MKIACIYRTMLQDHIPGFTNARAASFLPSNLTSEREGTEKHAALKTEL